MKNNPKEKIYERTEVLEAMYDLKGQGFKHITAMILTDTTLALACNKATHREMPQINIDSINCWYENDLTDVYLKPAIVAGITKYDYWWIFD